MTLPFLVHLLYTVTISSGVIIEEPGEEFEVYWNVPSFQCRPHKIFFTNVTRKYGIVQNERDDFRGDRIAILYDPGDFPAILEDTDTGKYFLRNGGVPQEGNLTLHREIFKESLEQLMPDKNFNGVGVIDFESWRPVFRQHWGALALYKTISYEVERNLHPNWTEAMVQQEAVRRFEESAREFMEETLHVARETYPDAVWGYYAYPYCFNLSPNNMDPRCSETVTQENDRINWLFQLSTAYFPSVYLPENSLSDVQKLQLIEGRVVESKRIANNLNKAPKKPKIYPYVWLKYRDTQKYIPKMILEEIVTLLKALRVDGMIIWGSSNDVNSRYKCDMLYDYVDTVLGPVLIEK